MRRGSLLLEALLGVAVFALLAGAVASVLFVGQEGSMQSGDRIRAVFLASEALGAAQSMRDTSFDLLIPGQYGVCVGASGKWEFCGSDSVSSDGFHTTLAVQSLGEDHVRITAETKWRAGQARSGSVLLTEELTDWRAVKPIGDWATVHLEGTYAIEGQPLFSGVALQGQYAFVTSGFGEGGKGLHVFDYSVGGDPVPVATDFSLGVAAYAVLFEGDLLYVATADPSAEIQIFDASSPATLSLSNRLATVDLPGEGRARTLAYHDSTLFVGALEDTVEQELYAYDITDPSAPELIGSLDDTASYYGLSLHDAYAYVAGSMDASELRVVDVFDATDLALAPGEGYNLTDTHDALTIAAVNDDLLIGRRSGDAIEEFVLLDLSTSAVPLPPPGPWFQEIGGSVAGLTMEPGGRYAFLATDNIAAQLQVADLAEFRAGHFAIVTSATTSHGGGRAVAYDALHDWVLLATDRALLLYRPGA
ncbi:MAG: hypothetical protein V1876_03595 [Candidatus Peregrinibacteria bacterium]